MSNKILSAVIGASSGLIVSHLLLSEENPPENIEYDSITGKMKIRLVRPTPYKEVFGQFIELLINAGAFVAGREVFFTITEGIRLSIPAIQYRLNDFFRAVRSNLRNIRKLRDLRKFGGKVKRDLENLKKGRKAEEEIKITENTEKFMEDMDKILDEVEEYEKNRPKEEKKFDSGLFFTGQGENVIGIPKPFEFTEFEKEDKGKEEKEIIIELEEEQKIEEVVDKIEQIIPNNPVDVEISNQPLIDDLKQDTGEEIIDESEIQNQNVLINQIYETHEKMLDSFVKIVKGDILNLTPETKKRTEVVEFLKKLLRLISQSKKKYDYLARNLDFNELYGIIDLVNRDIEFVSNRAIEMGLPSSVHVKTKAYKGLINKLLTIANSMQKYILLILRTFLGITGQANLITSIDNYRRDLEITNNVLSRQQLNQIRNLQIDFSVENINTPVLRTFFSNLQDLFVAFTK